MVCGDSTSATFAAQLKPPKELVIASLQVNTPSLAFSCFKAPQST
jgi:hypothetical protein